MEYSELIQQIPELEPIGVLVDIARSHSWTFEFDFSFLLNKSSTHDVRKIVTIGMNDYKTEHVNIWIHTVAHELGHIISNCDTIMYRIDRQFKINEEFKAWKIAFSLLQKYLPSIVHGVNLLKFLNDSQFSLNTYIREDSPNRYSDAIEDVSDLRKIVFGFLPKIARKRPSI